MARRKRHAICKSRPLKISILDYRDFTHKFGLDHRISFKYKFFGGDVGEPLPSIDEHRKASKPGRPDKKKPNTRAVSRNRFEPVADVSALLQ